MRPYLFITIVFSLFFVASAAAQTNYDTSPNAQTGGQIFGSYFATDIDTVGVYNGNLSLRIPLFSLPGRELGYGLALTYNGQKWESDSVDWTTVGRYTGGWKKGNIFGEPLSFFHDYNGCYIYWIDGGGAKHKFVPQEDEPAWCNEGMTASSWNSQTFKSMDTDGSTLWTGQHQTNGTDTARINFKNGHILYFRTSNSSMTYDYVTPNGNYLVKNTSNESVLPTQDTLGRSVGYSCSGCGGSSWTETYTVTDSGGTGRTYVLSWTKATSYSGTNFVDPFLSNHPAVQITMLNSITLPNSKTYTFEYSNQHGMLTKVTLPSGAYINYTYSTSPFTTSPAVERVTERKVSVDGTTNGEKLWQYTATFTGWKVTVTSPVSDKVVHYFNSNGQETSTEWQTSSSVVLKKVENTWAQDYVDVNGQPVNRRITTSKTYLNGTLYSTKDMAYDSTNMNLVQDKLTEGTGAAGQVKNQRDITYTTITGNFKVPTQETLTGIDPSLSPPNNFVIQGKTIYQYDQYDLTARSSVPNHTGNTNKANRGNVTTIKRYKNATECIKEQQYFDSVGNLVKKFAPVPPAAPPPPPDPPLEDCTTTTLAPVSSTPSTFIEFADNFCTLTGTPPTCSNTTGHSSFAYSTQVTNALSQSVSTKYDYNTGLPTVSIDVRSYEAKTLYDLMNRVTKVIEPNGKQTTYAYDDTNRVTTKEVTVDASGNKGHVETYFDKLYRVTMTKTNDPEGTIAVDAVYDDKGRKVQASNPYRFGSETKVWTTTTFDAADRLLQVQAPDSSVVTYSYSFDQTTVTDEAGNQRRYTYNPLGQMTKVEEPNPTLLFHTPLMTTYKYYGFGPLYRSDQSSQQRTFTYNWLGLMSTQALPESGTTTFAYDAAGRLTSKTDARSLSIIYCYDDISRMTKKMYSGSCASPGSDLVTFGYDAGGYTGHRTSMSDALGSVSYTYDTMDRLTQESRTLTGVSGTFTTGYEYNIKGDLTKLTYPSGRQVEFNYADGGGCCNSRLEYVKDLTTNTKLVGDMTFNAAGETLTRKLNPDSTAIAQTFQYNSRLQLTQIAASIGGTSVMNFTYDYGTSSTNTGRVLTRTDAIQPEHSQSYVYDSIYRLSQVTSGDKTWNIGWTFDVFGNRLTQTPQGLATSKIGSATSGYELIGGTSVPNNRLLAGCLNAQSQPVSCFDAAGNQVDEGPGKHKYTFNAENQITQMDGGAATYAYDGEGRRMKKSVNGETTYAFYGPGGTLCEFSTVAGTSTATAAGSSDRTVYRSSDRLGSAVLQVGSAGSILENNRTLPYGESWLADVNSVNDKKFTNYHRDMESGLDYSGARYFANAAGRFSSPDKGGATTYVPLTLNRYVYAGNDPINHTDPDGNAAICFWLFPNEGKGRIVCFPIPEPPGGGLSSGPGPDPLPCPEGPSRSLRGGCSPEPEPEPEPQRRLTSFFPEIAEDDRTTVSDALTMALEWTKNDKCDTALAGDGIPSLASLLSQLNMGNVTAGGNIFDGRVSIFPWVVQNGNQTTIMAYLNGNEGSVGAVAPFDANRGFIFLGNAFFNPDLAGVPNTYYRQAQAFILLHEAVHAIGHKTDTDFGTSRALTDKLVDNCFPVLAGERRLGNLY